MIQMDLIKSAIMKDNIRYGIVKYLNLDDIYNLHASCRFMSGVYKLYLNMRRDILYHLSQYFRFPHKIFDLMCSYPIVISGCIAESFRFHRTYSNGSSIYIKGSDRDLNDIKSIIRHYFIVYEQATYRTEDDMDIVTLNTTLLVIKYVTVQSNIPLVEIVSHDYALINNDIAILSGDASYVLPRLKYNLSRNKRKRKHIIGSMIGRYCNRIQYMIHGNIYRPYRTQIKLYDTFWILRNGIRIYTCRSRCPLNLSEPSIVNMIENNILYSNLYMFRVDV